jgi:diguanylate cyclase (GGDEF)-like protein
MVYPGVTGHRTLRHDAGQTMSPPLQLLYQGGPPPADLSDSGYGPLVVHPLDSLTQVVEALDQQAYDAIVFVCATPQHLSALLQWPGLSRAVLDAAVLVVTPEPELVHALQLVRLGVQDVVPLRAGLASQPAEALPRALRLAIERKQLEREARKAYATDLATGLPNHAQLMEHMTHLLALREREPAAMALLALRVDGLTTAAQRLGAEAANVLRRKVAVRLRAGLRASDVVASIGSDSFAVLLAWIDTPADGQRVAEKLAAALQRPFSVAGQDAAVAVSVGVAQYPVHGKEADSLLRRALSQAGDAPLIGRAGLAGRGSGSAAANDE